MSKIYRLVILSILLAAAPQGSAALAQGGPEACPTLVEEALALVDQSCELLPRNAACYGHNAVTATGWDSTQLADFAGPGDTAELNRLASLATAPLDAAAGQWGVAVLSLRADLPEMLPGQNVTFVLFGDAQLRSDVPPEVMAAPTPTCTAQAGTQAVNVRSGPETAFPVLGTLGAGQAVTATGRSESGEWLRVSFQGQEGWAYAPLLTLDCPPQTLVAATPGETQSYTAPMQAFYLTTGLADPLCAEAPRDGLLVQSPEGVTVHFRVNGVEIALSSTVFMRAPDEQHLVIGVLEGHADIVSGGERVSLEVGQRAALEANVAPGAPEPWSNAIIGALPVRLLPQVIPVPLIVMGNAAWVDSRVPLTAGQSYTVQAAGLVNPCTGMDRPDCIFYGPGGMSLKPDDPSLPAADVPLYPLAHEPIAALVGRIGEGAPFLVGDGGTFTADSDGLLRFQVNDHPLDNNAGAFVVVVTAGE